MGRDHDLPLKAAINETAKENRISTSTVAKAVATLRKLHPLPPRNSEIIAYRLRKKVST
jgi:hypothetical protein